MTGERPPLAGKIAIITGAGSTIGLGHAMTLAMVGAGARVAMVDVNEVALAHSAEHAQLLGGPDCVLPIVADVSSPTDTERAVQTTLNELGGLHILVNNAGISVHHVGVQGAPEFWEVPPEAWFKVTAVNYFGAFLMARAAVKPLRAQGWGRIIGVTTGLDTMWRGASPWYGASKAAHEAFVVSMSETLKDSGVTANILIPGGSTSTNLLPPDSTRDRSKMLQPDIMGPPAVWLASEASNGFTGRRIIAQRWDERLPIAERLARASSLAAWQELGRQDIHGA
ncbi:MAG: SDR family oxidoreductase [Chloroflexi bacterium]|nr:SDR family oxidoreductase [Chloroflexota bacterium]